MKKLKLVICLAIGVFFLQTNHSYAQKRIKPPKKTSKVEKVDEFVYRTFRIYDAVFVYDSLETKGIKVSEKYDKAVFEETEKEAQVLYEMLPDIVEEVDNASAMRKVKAGANLNKARKAITFCVKFFKDYMFE